MQIDANSPSKMTHSWLNYIFRDHTNTLETGGHKKSQVAFFLDFLFHGLHMHVIVKTTKMSIFTHMMQIFFFLVFDQFFPDFCYFPFNISPFVVKITKCTG